MPSALTFAVGQTADFNQPIREVAVSVGTVIVSRGDDVEVVKGPEGKLDCKNLAGHHFYSPDGAAFSLTYSDEPIPTPPAPRKSAGADAKGAKKRTAAKPKKAAKTERGDTGGGESGGFESRTRDQLRAEAKKRKVAGYSKMSKPQLVKALRS